MKVNESVLINGRIECVTRDMTAEEEAAYNESVQMVEESKIDQLRTEEGRIKAQIEYTAFMTDTWIGGDDYE